MTRRLIWRRPEESGSQKGGGEEENSEESGGETEERNVRETGVRVCPFVPSETVLQGSDGVEKCLRAKLAD